MMQLLNTKITQIEPKTDRTKWIHFLLRIGVLGFSAISTILLGLKGNRPGWDTQLSNVVLILTATVTFMSALASFWDIENYWVRLKIMLNRLKTLRYEFVFRVMENKEMSNQTLKEFLDRFVATQEDEYWDQFYKHLNK
ncbi:uncharacterized protein DUF4231 [Dyadobacter jejuensis]|uniref:Uncharacterized protein DUF4231 n=1 Tax=Dyadobacter jejuensis TaxID=1082580 RepID=A0A316AIL0_9BACT|nr:SLATT domain-containing protein [Dyadobacter jejuensis]PWJ57481.1 uncharacterized protein DUF4231 [Dyadobacter jejuensis]